MSLMFLFKSKKTIFIKSFQLFFNFQWPEIGRMPMSKATTGDGNQINMAVNRRWWSAFALSTQPRKEGTNWSGNQVSVSMCLEGMFIEVARIFARKFWLRFTPKPTDLSISDYFSPIDKCISSIFYSTVMNRYLLTAAIY